MANVFKAIGRLSLSNILNIFVRILQVVGGLVVIGMYATDINNAYQQGKYGDSKWWLATATGIIAAIAGISLIVIGALKSYRMVAFLWPVDAIVAILYMAVVCIFAPMYLYEKEEMDGGIHRMKVAVGFDFAGLIMWCLTAAFGCYWFFAERRGGRTKSTV